jgi:hypothetical protein
MHINAKRMKRRINNEPRNILFSTSFDLIDNEGEIAAPIEKPDYLKIKDAPGRAATLGIKIDKGKHGKGYTIEGDLLDTLGEDVRQFDNLQSLNNKINELWEIATEPHIEYYTDSTGRLYERAIYPASLV